MRDRGRPRLDIDLQWTPEERDRLDSMSTETRWLNREAWARIRGERRVSEAAAPTTRVLVVDEGPGHGGRIHAGDAAHGGGGKMIVGRDLDALVAEKVMGWVWLEKESDKSAIVMNERCLVYPDFEEKVNRSGDDAIIILPGIPDYSTDIASAWEVVEKLRADDWLVTVKAMPDCASYLIEGSRSEYDAPCSDRHVGNGKQGCFAENMRKGINEWRRSEGAIADTVPLAICLAALKVTDGARVAG
jgi:hypothetical protein